MNSKSGSGSGFVDMVI
jgi:hypothetical protein